MTELNIDIHGDIQCPHCKEWTNGQYIIPPNLPCWSCGEMIFGEKREYTLPRTLDDMDHILKQHSQVKMLLKNQIAIKKFQILAWLGAHRDKLPPEAVKDLQTILER